jgi:hypothetical protein
VLIANRSGVVLNTGSPGALWGSPNLTHYAAAKGAIHSLTLVLYKELYAQGIRVNTIVPGADTGRQVAPPELRENPNWLMAGVVRRGDPLPERNGPVVAYLCSDECADITGRTVAVGGDVIGQYLDPAPVRPQHQAGGWTIAGLQQTLHQLVSGPAQFYQGDQPPPRPPRPGASAGRRRCCSPDSAPECW